MSSLKSANNKAIIEQFSAVESVKTFKKPSPASGGFLHFWDMIAVFFKISNLISYKDKI